MTEKKGAKSAKQASQTKAQGIPVTAETPVYQGRSRGVDVGSRLVEFLAERQGEAFTEPMLANEFGFFREGKPHQQRINGPLRKVWDRIEETAKQPSAVPKGSELRMLAVKDPATGRLLKGWAVVPAE